MNCVACAWWPSSSFYWRHDALFGLSVTISMERTKRAGIVAFPITRFHSYRRLPVGGHHHHHHHHVPEGLGMFPVPWSSRWSWSLHLFIGRPMFLRLFGLYCSACFGALFVSCCSHFSWYCFISFTMFCAPVWLMFYSDIPQSFHANTGRVH